MPFPGFEARSPPLNEPTLILTSHRPRRLVPHLYLGQACLPGGDTFASTVAPAAATCLSLRQGPLLCARLSFSCPFHPAALHCAEQGAEPHRLRARFETRPLTPAALYDCPLPAVGASTPGSGLGCWPCRNAPLLHRYLHYTALPWTRAPSIPRPFSTVSSAPIQPHPIQTPRPHRTAQHSTSSSCPAPRPRPEAGRRDMPCDTSPYARQARDSATAAASRLSSSHARGRPKIC